MNDLVTYEPTPFTSREQTVESENSLRIFVRSWHPTGAPHSCVVIVHGFKAHSGLYAWVASQLAERGFAVYAMDLRGHGKSEGESYWVESFDEYVADLHAVLGAVRARNPGAPVFLFGHSAGGVVSVLYALEHPGTLSGLISESLAFELPPPDVALALIKGLSYVAPHAHVLALEDEHFSRDPAFVAAMKADPLIHREAGPSQTLAAMVRADERIRLRMGELGLPLLVMHGTADRATKQHGSERLYAAAGSADKTLRLYEGYYHDLFNDLGKEQPMSDLLAWLGTRAKENRA